MVSLLSGRVNNSDMDDGLNLPENPVAAMQELGTTIDSLIEKIRDEICVSNPEQLLFQITELYWMSGAEISDDALMFGPSGNHVYPVEYVQSLLMVQQSHEPRTVSPEELEKVGYQVLLDVEELSSLTDCYILAWASQFSKEHDSSFVKFALEAQLMYMVRGNRYQFVQKQYFKPLLLPHDAEFRKVFGVSAAEIVDGLMRIEDALSQGRLNGMNDLMNLVESLPSGFATSPESLSDDERIRLSRSLESTFTVAKYNVGRITGWPDKLIQCLSFSIGGGRYFEKGRYQYWPIVAQPIWERPFITIDGEAYCFDYWSTMDNFYRALQGSLERIDPDYSNQWTVYQKKASEGMVADIFSKMLPGSIIYSNNYYGSRKNRCENDLLVHYYDILIIVEVKAGAFTYAPPITDVASHIKRYEDLVGSADFQCLRLKQYVESSDKILELYEGNEATSPRKAAIDLSVVTDVFTISVTLDNMNAFANRAEKLSFLNIEGGGISIAMDDLLTYQDYFDSPLKFLHFLKQRRAASRNRRIALFDELDHLGMYIEHNCYSMTVDGLEDADTLIFDGYREKLDNYYNLRANRIDDAEKPAQSLPGLFEDILNALENSNTQNKVQVASHLLDFSSDAKEEFAQNIYKVVQRQRLSRTQTPLNLSGGAESIRQTTFIVQPFLTHSLNMEEMVEYASAILLANEEDSRWLMVIQFNEDNILEEVYAQRVTSAALAESDRERLLKRGKDLADYRVTKYIETNGKIGRNQPCPCGSGKKYKRCHGAV